MSETLERNSVLQVLDVTGHMTVSWNPRSPDEVENAESIFDDMIGKGYNAFRVTGADQQGARISEFDPKAAKIMMVPQLRGG